MQADPSATPPVLVHFAGGAVGSCLGIVCTNPLEVVRTRLQSRLFRAAVLTAPGAAAPTATALVEWARCAQAPVGLRTANAVLCIWRQEGAKALFRGTLPSVMGIAPLRAVHFSLYNHLKALFPADMRSSPSTHLSCAFAAGVVTSTLGCPLWVVKTRLQLQLDAPTPAPTPTPTPTPTRASVGGGSSGPRVYASASECLRSVVREDGVRGLFRGLGASYWGISEIAIQFVLYERLREHAVHAHASLPTATAATDTAPVSHLFVAAALSKLAASAITYPHEVVRTRVREPEWPSRVGRSLVQVLSHLARTEGIGAWYGGMAAHLLRTVPNSALMFTGYELVCALYRS